MAVSQTGSDKSSVSAGSSTSAGPSAAPSGADGPKQGQPSSVSPAKLEREARLAAALRENLRRRKAQQRARTSGAGEPEAD